jgi:hypothetical protein
MRSRILFVGLVAGMALSFFALPALAKGEGQEGQAANTQIVITGPGLSGPIVITGQLFSYGEYGYTTGAGSASASQSSDLDAILTSSGISGGGTDVGWYELQPDLSAIGPAYSMTVMVDFSSPQAVAAPQTIVADLYPFAPDRPMVSFHPGQIGLSRQRLAQWWSAPPALVSLLGAHGLPAVPPAAAPAPHRVPQPASPQTWLWVWTIAALAALVGAGALLGRKRPMELA